MLKEDDLVICKVKKIDGATIFLDIQGDGEGSLALPEIAAGRIRNIREYVVPNKIIVCKVLKIINGHPQLSLRRVTSKEREFTLEKDKKEKTFISIIKKISKDSEKAIERIKEKFELSDFYEKAKEDVKIISDFFSKAEAELLTKIFSEKKDKEKEVKKTFLLRSNSPSGLHEIQDTLNFKDVEIHYLGSSKFSISAKAKEFKDANAKVDATIQKIKDEAHKKKLVFEA